MSKHSVKKLPKSTLQVTLEIPWETIQKEYEKAFLTLMKDLEVEGFRKGKAPRSVAEKNMPKDKVYDTMIRAYIPNEYDAILKKEDIKAIASPKIELTKAKENEEWVITFTVPLKPEIDLKNYKDIIQKAKKDADKPEIWTPGKDKDAKPDENAKKDALMQAALNALLDKTKVELSDVIVDEEVNARLMKLVEDLQKLGITVENYVKSRNTTVDDLKAQFKKEIEETYKLEFILQEIGETEKITVEKADMDKLLGSVKDDKERAAFMQNAYYYASLLRKQKILEHIMSL